MSTPEQPLTRRQLRERGLTGAVPIQRPIDSEAEAADAEAAERGASATAETASAPRAERMPDLPVDLDSAPLTRRQARMQEKLRTASIGVVSPDVVETEAEARTDAEADVEAEGTAVVESEGAAVVESEDTTVVETEADAEVEADAEAEEEADATAETDAEADADADTEVETDTDNETDTDVEVDADADAATGDGAESEIVVDAASEVDDDTAAAASGVTISPEFGAALLAAEPEVSGAHMPPSFDELIARNASTASLATPSALILSQTPAAPPLTGPITATGEVIVTGSYQLPAGLGSTAADPSVTDGKDVDAVLIDGELPASSSPTPIAASSAVSTVRGDVEIIRPPAPEKGNRLILSLAITAGVLAIAVIAVLVVALTNGVFS